MDKKYSGADYILALKGNQPEMLDRVSSSFNILSLLRYTLWRVNPKVVKSVGYAR